MELGFGAVLACAAARRMSACDGVRHYRFRFATAGSISRVVPPWQRKWNARCLWNDS